MRKFIAIILVATYCTAVYAQSDREYVIQYTVQPIEKVEEAQKKKSKNLFNHLGLAVGVGTTGITADLATTITQWFQLRLGADIVPSALNLKSDLTLKEHGVINPYNNAPVGTDISVENRFAKNTAHVILDIFPFSQVGFHLSVGAYYGTEPFVSLYNAGQYDELRNINHFNNRVGDYSNVPQSAGKIGASLGEYFIEPNAGGELGASIRVKKLRPYVGFGFGRTVPKSRINCMLDFGVQLWGNPQVWNDKDNYQLTTEGTEGEDKGILQMISKTTLYPVISFKLVGKLF